MYCAFPPVPMCLDIIGYVLPDATITCSCDSASDEPVLRNENAELRALKVPHWPTIGTFVCTLRLFCQIIGN
jgi:hypothetical protein